MNLRRRWDLNPCAATNSLLTFQASPFDHLGTSAVSYVSYNKTVQLSSTFCFLKQITNFRLTKQQEYFIILERALLKAANGKVSKRS